VTALTKAFALVLLACTVFGCTASNPAAPPASSTLSQDLPASISGRWRYPPDGTSQVFSLQDIKVQPDKTFTAKLTWWQTNSWCATRDLPIVGRQGDFGGIAFEVPRMCGIAYLVELNRSSSGWVGKASSMSGFGLYLDLKAD
jgi:hypothetical protein